MRLYLSSFRRWQHSRSAMQPMPERYESQQSLLALIRELAEIFCVSRSEIERMPRREVVALANFASLELERESSSGPTSPDAPLASSGGFRTRPPPAQATGELSRRKRTLPYQPTGLPEDPSHAYFSDEFLAPTSSNVYSFQFFRRPHDTFGILYVTYKASGINRSALSKGGPRHRGGRRQLRGTPGATVRGGARPNQPGPTYGYSAVPTHVFDEMKRAYSKGTFVWDSLRIRGTIHGHRYNYFLATGQLLTNKQGEYAGQYVPRLATKKGFRTRSVSDFGLGRRSFVSSTLP